MSNSSELLKAVAVTAELCGRVLSPEAAAVFVDDLSGYPEPQVMVALRRCRKEVRGILTVNDVVTRLDDGRPSSDEAWSSIPFDESQSVVWTDEAAQAWGLVSGTFEAGDRVGARFAFKAAYDRLVSEAREARRQVVWTPSLGTESSGRVVALEQAARLGRISEAQLAIADMSRVSPKILSLVSSATKRIQ